MDVERVHLEVNHHPWTLCINLPSFTGFSEATSRSTLVSDTKTKLMEGLASGFCGPSEI